MSESPPEPASFEHDLAELEQVVRDLEDGDIGLETALARYERGVALVKRCFAQLRDAEQRILLVTGVDEQGKPVLQPFRHSATEAATPDVKRTSLRKRANDPTI